VRRREKKVEYISGPFQVIEGLLHGKEIRKKKGEIDSKGERLMGDPQVRGSKDRTI